MIRVEGVIYMPDKKRPGQEERKKTEKETRPPPGDRPSSAAKPGQNAARSGEYVERGPRGGEVSTPRQVTIEARNNPLPATQKPGRAWENLSVVKKDMVSAPAEHWGQKVIAAIKALPEDMRNDPAYADPVAWVKRARENDAPPDDSDSE